MAITLRLVKGSALTWAQQDENTTWLTRNISGAVINITGASYISSTGSLTISTTFISW